MIRLMQVGKILENASNLFFYIQFPYGIKYMRKLAPIIPATINAVINIPFFVIFLLLRLSLESFVISIFNAIVLINKLP